jgi:hypothetical protein
MADKDTTFDPGDVILAEVNGTIVRASVSADGKADLDWASVPWTEFLPCELPDGTQHPLGDAIVPAAMFMNSRYVVSCYRDPGPAGIGRIAHLSIKTHNRQAYHDWRDLQRIKNELVGPEFDAVEIYPKESHLVDSANQYHLWVFLDSELPFGFREPRLVCDESHDKSRQRPWAPEDRPADCIDGQGFAQRVTEASARLAARKAEAEAHTDD